MARRIKEVGADQIGARTFGGPHQERVLVDEILDELIVEYKRGGRRCIPREVNPQMQSHLKRVRDYFGAMRTMRVRKRDVNGFISTLKAEGRQNATVNRSTTLGAGIQNCLRL